MSFYARFAYVNRKDYEKHKEDLKAYYIVREHIDSQDYYVYDLDLYFLFRVSLKLPKCRSFFNLQSVKLGNLDYVIRRNMEV